MEYVSTCFKVGGDLPSDFMSSFCKNMEYASALRYRSFKTSTDAAFASGFVL
jgi:hypothetical protein